MNHKRRNGELKPWQHILLGFFVGMVLTAVIFLVSVQPQGNPVQLLPAPTTSPILIDISGAVENPGTYKLLPGSRLKDAVSASNGLKISADRDLVNLAAVLKDGEKIYIPSIGEENLLVDQRSSTAFEEKNSPLKNSSQININTASINDLQLLPGIGEVRAKLIIEYRENHGEFLSIDEIKNISGIGIDTFERIKDLITIQ